jgi:N-acetylglutamate synthase-like GNAT family acetyltransferase
MKNGRHALGPASCVVSYSYAVPSNMRGKLREITGLQVKRSDRGQGHGTALLKQVAEEADKAALALLVVVEPYDSEKSQWDLGNWYRKHGFVDIQVSPRVMVRAPKQ